MGSYSFLRIGDINLRLVSEEDDFNPTVLVLFDETDKRVREFSGEDDQIPEDWDDPPEFIVDYAISLTVAKDRLEFMGFTMSKVSHIFQEGREERIADLAQRRTDSRWTTKDHMKTYLDQEEKIWKELTFEIWLKGFTYIVANKLEIDKRYDELFSFPSYDHRAFLRAAIEVIGTDGELVYDLTELISKHFSADADFCADARWQMSDDLAIQKIVVLTEGKSDKWVLEGALQLLYPHLASYYSFMDFDSARVAGSASELVKMVKAFIGAGISNRIIALFDNDTAAQSAMRALKEIKIPKHVRVLRYPDIQLAKSYPTLGPQGTVVMDVNGLAGSLELYFGLDVLTGEDSSLTPIQWRGYDEALHQYQGEVLNKGKLQEKFKSKLRDCHADRSLIDKFDWDGIQAIIKSLRTTFHDTDAA